MNQTLALLFASFVAIALLSGCESNNERVKRVVKETVNSVTADAILQSANELDLRQFESEGSQISLESLPPSFAAFEPVEVLYMHKGAYRIVTAMWNQHRTGLRITAPGEAIPASTEYVTYEKLADRLYLYQD
jgi:hypothetical protein